MNGYIDAVKEHTREFTCGRLVFKWLATNLVCERRIAMNDHRGLWRGKRTDTKAWITGDLMNGTDLIDCTEIAEHTGVGSRYDVIPETLGECTGLTDKKGTLIFEGDILQADEYRFVVKFGKCGGVQNTDHEVGYIGFYVIPVGNEAKLFFNSGIRTDILYWLSAYDVSIIGNIHDNPELISGQTD